MCLASSSYIQKLRATVETVLHPSMTKGVCIGGCLDRQKKKKGGDIRYVLVERNYGECFAIFFVLYRRLSFEVMCT